jgi:hypothetical protein
VLMHPKAKARRTPDMTGPVKVLPGRFFMRVSFLFFSFGR